MSEIPRFTGTHRGVFGLSSWASVSKPGESFLGSEERSTGSTLQKALGALFDPGSSQRKENVNNSVALLSNGQSLEKTFSSNANVTNGDAAKGDSKKPRESTANF